MVQNIEHQKKMQVGQRGISQRKCTEIEINILNPTYMHKRIKKNMTKNILLDRMHEKVTFIIEKEKIAKDRMNFSDNSSTPEERNI